MLPYLKIGSLQLPTYHTVLVLGIIGMCVLCVLIRKYYRLSSVKAVIFSLLLAFTGILGTKILFFIENGGQITLGGFSFFGAVFLIPLLMPLFGLIPWFKLKPGESLDICAPCVALMIGTMRIGCFLNGCCGGVQATIKGRIFHWPTQAMESICDFVMLYILLEWLRKGKHKSQHYHAFMAGYGVVRFLIEFLRDTPKDWLGMSHGQWFSIAGIIAGVIGWIVTEKNRGKVSH